ncbi:5-oxoprolinase subunit PxpB [Pseudalkalibacillus hwajinpoensis]|uniref:5-oxoprolinase subunit PxpB n=1 Tax=Guptibacillus hwajinpoensis TaxID=208199 RepID=A0A4U1MJ69_9BACL|nr:5-oxoprolinase subunit PxpB [Pseudalkalibacillus hwajinpoensis]TKD70522.1 5-oxoprolinase subunit PxpB [Pseudalkalibacillus hwajinpoensis]
MSITFHPLGEAAVKVSFHQAVSPSLNNIIKAFCTNISLKDRGIIEWVPAYDSVTVYYDPWIFTYQQMTELLNEIALKTEQKPSNSKTIVTIPTLYGGEYGPDLEELAETKKLKTEDVISIHTDADYLVNMIGFLPGFPYLSGLDEKISMARLEEPRQAVPAGSVGIAGSQTGIYPLESPGGWNLIGRTPLRLYDLENENPFLLEQGDYLQFKSITKEEFEQIKREIDEGTYKLERKEETK